MVVVVVVGTAAEIDRCYALLCFALLPVVGRVRPGGVRAATDGRIWIGRRKRVRACVLGFASLSLSLSSSISFADGWWMVLGAWDWDGEIVEEAGRAGSSDGDGNRSIS